MNFYSGIALGILLGVFCILPGLLMAIKEKNRYKSQFEQWKQVAQNAIDNLTK